MRSQNLTRTSRRINGVLASDYEWRGNVIAVHDSARTATLVFELFADEELTTHEKGNLLVRMLFPDPQQTVELAGQDLGELLVCLCWDAFGLDISEDHRYTDEYQEKVFDWVEDSARIRASLLQAYGLDWDDAAANMPFSVVCALLGSLLEMELKTPFQQAIYYRTAEPPKRTKYNEELCDAFAANAKHFALGSGKENIEAQNDAMADMFAAMKRAAKEA